MDFITGLPPSILVMVDHLRKYAHFCALPSNFTSTKVVVVFVAEIMRLHGLPHTIVSDRDPLFLSNFRQELFHLQGTKLSISTIYHPQTDGQSEVLYYCLEMPPPSLLRYIPGTFANKDVHQELQTREDILSSLKSNLARAQVRIENQADKGRVDAHYSEDFWKPLRIHSNRQEVAEKSTMDGPGLYGLVRNLENVTEGNIAGKILYSTVVAGTLPKIDNLPDPIQAGSLTTVTIP
ncbi:uncharacterized protein LOC122065461 [Macadamia integrifolia]|uniref:uncharacterized protein LOC122065461 n=1 Tax=Macadamia integrifolia TaxID=60698 RepID=UPI001C4EF364|nr:uncharacterized protein LOC122065461 [Macadamia integrifolia]